MFVDREFEVGEFKKLKSSGKPEFVIAYGRRRVGKTELLKQFLFVTKGVYLLGRQQSEKEQLKLASQRVAAFYKDDFLAKNPFSNWDAFFTYFKERGEFCLVMDEFPYFVQSSPALPSIMQDYWDNHFSRGKAFLVICGSSLSMMEDFLKYKSPLYGRRTGQFLLKPLGFRDARSFFPRSLPLEKIVEFYSVLGGTPAYLKEFDYSKDLWRNLEEKVFVKNALLYDDVLFVLREELDEPRYYFSILSAIAQGNNSVGRIVNASGLDKGVVSKYLGVLQSLDVVERRVPVTEKNAAKSRRGIYVLKDHFFRFWFRFVYPHADDVERGFASEAVRACRRDFNSFVGGAFQDVAEAWVRENFRDYGRVGGWWNREEEVDVVALGEGKKPLVFEVKWRSIDVREAEGLLRELERKTSLMELADRPQLSVIAKELEGKAVLRSRGVLAFDLRDLLH